MSDTTDYSGVVAGQARVVYSNPAYVPGTTPTQHIPLLQTDRSLVVLMSLAFNNDKLAVVGDTSAAPYSPGDAIDSPNVWGWVCPAYGAADPTVSLRITGNVTARAVTVIAVPDETTFGETWAPQAVQLVANGAGALIGVVGNPLVVELTDGVNTPIGAHAHPVSVNAYSDNDAASTSVGVNVTTSVQTLIGAPAAGKLRIVDMVTVRASGGNTMEFRGPVGLDLDLASSAAVLNPPLFPAWILGSGGGAVTVQMSAGAATCWASYHDVTL